MSKTDTPDPPTKRVLQVRSKGKHFQPPALTGVGKGVAVRRWFWCGMLPSISTRGAVKVGGTTFVKIHETVKAREPGQPSVRTPQIGSVAHLSKADLASIDESLPDCVYRVTDAPREVTGPGEGIEALDQQARRGHPIRIPTDAFIKARRKMSAHVKLYQPEKWDEALADHIFAVPCEDQDKPRVGVVYPLPLSETGLEWPE